MSMMLSSKRVMTVMTTTTTRMVSVAKPLNVTTTKAIAATSAASSYFSLPNRRWMSSGGGGGGVGKGKSKSKGNGDKSKKTQFKGFRPRRQPNPEYRPYQPPFKVKTKQRRGGGVGPPRGPKSPWDVSKPIPTIDWSNISVTDIPDRQVDADERLVTEDDNDELWFGPLANETIKMLREGKNSHTGGRIFAEGEEGGAGSLDWTETQLKQLDAFTSEIGSTEDLVGQRRALAMESLQNENRAAIIDTMDKYFHDHALWENLDLNMTDEPSEIMDSLSASSNNNATGTTTTQIPHNQLAHGDWGEMVIRTDRVCQMWRGGRIESYRALVVGGNLRGCGGFGIGKSFEPEDAVQIACRMARRNIFFVDRYRNSSLTHSLVGRQNSCKVYLRATDNGLRGNPLSCEILKLFGITNAVCKAHGNRNHYNVVRATFKALMTHESLEDIAMKRGVRLINLQKAKRLQV